MNSFCQTVIGILPNEWHVAELGSVCDVFSGFAFKSEDFTSQGIPVIKIGELQDGRTLLTKRTDYVPETFRCKEKLQRFTLRSGDLLIAMTGATTGKVARVSKEHDGSFLNQRVGKIFPETNKVDFDFIEFILQTQFAQKHIQNLILKSAQGNISPNQIKAMIIPLPSLNEQILIKTSLSVIEKNIESQTKIIQKTTELKRALMQKLLSEGLRGEKQKQTDIGLIPESWEVRLIGECFEVQQGKQLSNQNRHGKNLKKFLRTANVFWGKLNLAELDEMNFTEDEIKKLALRRDDLLVCEGGEIGRTAIWSEEVSDCYHQNHVHRLRKKSDDVMPLFVMYWMMEAFLNRHAYLGVGNKTTIPNLSQSRLKSLAVPIPAMKEQLEIAHALKLVDEKIDNANARKIAMSQLFQAMLHQLMTGQIRVKDLEAKKAVATS